MPLLGACAQDSMPAASSATKALTAASTEFKAALATRGLLRGRTSCADEACERRERLVGEGLLVAAAAAAAAPACRSVVLLPVSDARLAVGGDNVRVAVCGLRRL